MPYYGDDPVVWRVYQSMIDNRDNWSTPGFRGVESCNILWIFKILQDCVPRLTTRQRADFRAKFGDRHDSLYQEYLVYEEMDGICSDIVYFQVEVRAIQKEAFEMVEYLIRLRYEI
jgi:hypothetical protein